MEILERQLNNDRTKQNYKRVAWFYNLWSNLTESKAASRVIELVNIKDGEDIIELACGTGLLFKEIVKRNPNGKNLGIDLSLAMLSKATLLMKTEDKSNYELTQGDVLNLNIKDESFDKLINNFMIDLMPEDKFEKIVSEFYRILKPNGVAVISVFSEGQKKVNKIWILIAKYLPKLLTDCRPVEIKKNLMKAGFEIKEEIDLSQNTFPSKIYKVIKL